jgi:hypothetical protein
MAMRAHQSLNVDCPGGRCPPDRADALDGFRRTSTISTVAFIVGGVGAAAGITLMLTAPSGKGAPATTSASSVPQIGLWLGGPVVGFAGRF